MEVKNKYIRTSYDIHKINVTGLYHMTYTRYMRSM